MLELGGLGGVAEERQRAADLGVGARVDRRRRIGAAAGGAALRRSAPEAAAIRRIAARGSTLTRDIGELRRARRRGDRSAVARVDHWQTTLSCFG